MFLILLLLPGFLSTLIYYKLSNKNNINILITYGSYTFIINLFIFIIIYLTNRLERLNDLNNLTTKFTLVYLLLAFVFAIVVPFLFEILRRNIKIEIKAKKEVKK